MRENFSTFFQWAADQAAVDLECRTFNHTVRNDLAIYVGFYWSFNLLTTHPSAESGEATTILTQGDLGKFVTVAGRQDVGEWRVRIDGYNLAPIEAYEAAL